MFYFKAHHRNISSVSEISVTIDPIKREDADEIKVSVYRLITPPLPPLIVLCSILFFYGVKSLSARKEKMKIWISGVFKGNTI